MIATKHGVGAIVCLLVSARVAWADALPPTTFLLDSGYLGFPVGPIVGLALAAAAVAGFIVMNRKRVPTLLAAIVCIVLFVTTYILVFQFCSYMGMPRPPQPPWTPPPDRMRENEKKQEPEKPKAAPESP